MHLWYIGHNRSGMHQSFYQWLCDRKLKFKSPGVRHVTAFLFLTSFFSVGTSPWAQEKSIVQIKTFDQQHKPFPDLTISLNGKEFISIGNKGIAFVEMLESELPPKSIKIKGGKAEAVSWKYNNRVLEVIIKESLFTPATISVKNEKNEALPNLKVKFYGKKTFSTTTNSKGIFEVPRSVDEQISEKDQFKIKGYRIVRLLVEGKDKTIVAEALKKGTDAPKVAQEKTVVDDRSFKNFDIRKIDSIHSLTVFYAVFKNYKIETLDEKTKQSINAKFNELV